MSVRPPERENRPWMPSDRQITWFCNGVLILFGAGLGWWLS